MADEKTAVETQTNNEAPQKEHWEEVKEQFIAALRETKRGGQCGMEKLLGYLEQSGFYDAPATANFHGDFQHGLLLHSWAVYQHLLALMPALGIPDTKTNRDSVAIAALLHGVRENRYKLVSRTRRVNGEYVDKMEYVQNDEQLFFGGDDETLYIIMNYIKLKRPEAFAIRRVSGVEVPDARDRQCTLETWDTYPLAIGLHVADLLASFVDKL